MQKQRRGRKLSRKRDSRKALLRALNNALVLHEKIKTTEAKAKEISRTCEKLITIAKQGTLHSRRLLFRLFPPKTVKKLIEEIAPRYQARKGGYTRIIKIGPRKIDSAKMVIIELVK